MSLASVHARRTPGGHCHHRNFGRSTPTRHSGGQGGCPQGNGTGDPGFRYAGEFSDSVGHDRPGLLSMANAGPHTYGNLPVGQANEDNIYHSYGVYILPYIEQQAAQDIMRDNGAQFPYIHSGNNTDMHAGIARFPGFQWPNPHPQSNSDQYRHYIETGRNHGGIPKTEIEAFVCPSSILPKEDNDGFGAGSLAL